MSLQLNDELLSAFLDGEVTAEERQQIEAMLATSPEWQKRYRQMVEAVNLVRTLPEERLPRDFSQGILAQIAQRQQAEKTSELPAGPLPTGGSAPRVTVSAPSDRSHASRLRKKTSSASPAWLALAACVVVALGLGVALQTGMFDQGQTPVAVDDGKNTPVVANGGTLAANSDPQKGIEKPVIDKGEVDPPQVPFPDVEQLANQQNTLPLKDPAMDAGEEKGRSGFRFRMRTKPGESKDMPETMVRPPAIARSVYNLEKQDDLGLDQNELIPIDDPNVSTELVNWLDADQNGEISDPEMQQAWYRFSKPDMQAPAITEPTLKLIDHDMNEKISAAEFHLTIASVRWSSSEEIRRIWFRLDANGDGVWSREDFAGNARFAAIQNELTQWHTLLDRTRSGKVSRVEYLLSAGYMQLTLRNWEGKVLNPRVFEETQKLVVEFDRDGNGQLAGRELRRLKESRTELKSLLDDVDQKGISAYELYLLVESTQL